MTDTTKIGFGLAILAAACFSGVLILVASPGSFVGATLLRLSFILPIIGVWLTFYGSIRQTIQGTPPTPIRYLPDVAEPQPTDDEQPAVAHLASLSFTYLGTFETPSHVDDDMLTTHLYVDESERVTAGLSTTFEFDLVNLEAHFPDGHILEVSTPWGENIRTEGYQWEYTTAGVESAYQRIQTLIEEATTVHGTPNRVSHTADIITRHKHFEQHAKRHQQRRLRLYGYARVAGLVVFSACMLWMAALPWVNVFGPGNVEAGLQSVISPLTQVTGASVASLIALLAPNAIMAGPANRLAALEQANRKDDPITDEEWAW